MLTRRRFLGTLSALAAAPRLTCAQSFVNPLRKKTAPPLPSFVYFGTDTDKGVAKGIYLSRFDAATGRLTAPQVAAETPRPSFLAISPTAAGQRRLYAVNEVSEGFGAVSSFGIEPSSGAIKLINKVTSAGTGPCYISLDATGHSAFVANYSGSSIASYSIMPSGALSEPVERIDYKDRKFGSRGPNLTRQDVPHPHSVHLSPDNRFMLVNDLGSDQISVFAIDSQTARLGPATLFTNDRPGSGPRHIAFHPNGRWVYSINELDSTIDHFLWTTTSSRTEPKGLLVYTGIRVSTIAPGYPISKNTAAEVAVTPDGNFLYASNRGEDSLVVFAIASADGALTFIQRISCGGRTPRQFALSPDSEARWLLCGNQESATVTVFRRDGGSGRLGGPIQSIALDSVMFTLFA